MKFSARNWITKGIGFALVFAAISPAAWAVPVPEMDPGLATGAMALLSSGLLLIAGRRRSK